MIGVLGGTFDPIHYGHLRPANDVAQVLKLTELRLVVAAQSPHRDPPVASAAQRLQMAVAACAEFPRFHVDDREIKRGGLSYTVPTLSSLREEIGDEPMCLLLGSDAFAALMTWHEWQRLPTLAHLVVMRRPTAPGRPAAEPQLPPGLPARFAADGGALAKAPSGLKPRTARIAPRPDAVLSGMAGTSFSGLIKPSRTVSSARINWPRMTPPGLTVVCRFT